MGEPIFRLRGPAADSQCRRQWPRAGMRENGKQWQPAARCPVEQAPQAERRSRFATAGGGLFARFRCGRRLIGRHVSSQKGHRLVERESVIVARRRFRRQTFL